MSDPKQRGNRKPLKNTPPERFQPRVLFIWLAIFAAIAALWLFNPGASSNAESLRIHQVVEKAEAGDISEGVIKSDSSGGKDWAVLTGKFRNETGSGAQTIPFRAEGRLTD